MKLITHDAITEGQMYPDAYIWSCDIEALSPEVDEMSVCAGISIPLPFKISRNSFYRDGVITGYGLIRFIVRKTDIVYRAKHIMDIGWRAFLDVRR